MNLMNGFTPLPNWFISSAASSNLTNREFKLYHTIGIEIFRFPESREIMNKEMSTRYLQSLTGINHSNVSRILKKFEKRGLIRIVKSHVKGQGSFIYLIPPGAIETPDHVVKETPRAKKSDVTITANPINPISKKDLQEEDLDSSLNSQIEQAIEKNPQESSLDSSPDIYNLYISSEENNLNMSAINVLPAGLSSGKSEFSSLGSVLTSGLMNSPDINKTYGRSKDVDNSYSPSKGLYKTYTLSHKATSLGNAILLKKGFSPEEVSQITDRITASMTDKDIKSKDKYFIAACNNEKKNNSKVAVHNTSHKVADPLSRPSVKVSPQEQEKPVNPAELLEKIKLTAPTELFDVIMSVDNDRKTQRALEFLPGELKKEALANLYVAAFKSKYPEVSLK